MNQVLPKFATYYRLNNAANFSQKPKGYVEFNLTIRLDSVLIFSFKKNF